MMKMNCKHCIELDSSAGRPNSSACLIIFNGIIYPYFLACFQIIPFQHTRHVIRYVLPRVEDPCAPHTFMTALT